MRRYAVELTDAAMSAIHAQARYIAIDRQEPHNAQRWLQLAWDAIESLETMPKRCPLAEENQNVEYEARLVLVGTKSLIITVDDERATVWVIALRGEGQLSRPEYLPQHLDEIIRAARRPTNRTNDTQ